MGATRAMAGVHRRLAGAGTLMAALVALGLGLMHGPGGPAGCHGSAMPVTVRPLVPAMIMPVVSQPGSGLAGHDGDAHLCVARPAPTGPEVPTPDYTSPWDSAATPAAGGVAPDGVSRGRAPPHSGGRQLALLRCVSRT